MEWFNSERRTRKKKSVTGHLNEIIKRIEAFSADEEKIKSQADILHRGLFNFFSTSDFTALVSLEIKGLNYNESLFNDLNLELDALSRSVFEYGSERYQLLDQRQKIWKSEIIKALHYLSSFYPKLRFVISTRNEDNKKRECYFILGATKIPFYAKKGDDSVRFIETIVTFNNSKKPVTAENLLEELYPEETYTNQHIYGKKDDINRKFKTKTIKKIKEVYSGYRDLNLLGEEGIIVTKKDSETEYVINPLVKVELI